MDITPHVDALRQDLARAARAMGPETEQAAERLGVALDSSVRLALMEALSQAAAEITSELHGTSVEVRLQGREPVFTVVGAGPDAVADSGVPVDETVGDEGVEVARVTLRLPEALKARAEDLAGRHGQSLNTWLVNAVRAAATTGITINVNATGPGGSSRTRSTNKRVQGWVR